MSVQSAQKMIPDESNQAMENVTKPQVSMSIDR